MKKATLYATYARARVHVRAAAPVRLGAGIKWIDAAAVDSRSIVRRGMVRGRTVEMATIGGHPAVVVCDGRAVLQIEICTDTPDQLAAYTAKCATGARLAL